MSESAPSGSHHCGCVGLIETDTEEELKPEIRWNCEKSHLCSPNKSFVFTFLWYWPQYGIDNRGVFEV